jgi:Dolichyl-phosphate-mannose-protein mannosyltransferase
VQHQPRIGTSVAATAWVTFAMGLAVYAALLWQYSHANSAIFDEGEHISAGYRYWQCGDYGINPEHPPLVKLWTTIPIRHWQLGNFLTPCGRQLTSNEDLIGDGYRLINSENANSLLWKTRAFALVFPLGLLVTVFLATRMWFGPLAAAIAVVLTVFEPNLTAHGPLITTDMALTATMLLTAAMAWRFLNGPTLARALLLGMVLGCAMASKHSAVLLVPIVGLQFVADFVMTRGAGGGRLALRLLGGWIAACVVAAAILWSTYGFRYEALPDAHAQGFDLAGELHAAGMTHSLTGRALLAMVHMRVLPVSYLAGLLYVQTHSTRTAYLLGKELAKGVWYYFPITLSIKLTLPMILLLVVGLLAPWVWKRYPHEYLFLAIPVVVFLAAAMVGRINIGIRHILPVIPFLIIFSAAGAAHFWSRSKGIAAACLILLVAHAVSYSRSYPNEIGYANEAWGGPSHLYRYLGDSNVDWGQSLYAVRDYLQKQGIHDCWIAWFGMRKPAEEGIPCRSLAGPFYLEATDTAMPTPLPVHFQGTVLISVGLLDYSLYPYGKFLHSKPDAVVGGSVLVYHGSFDMPEVAANREAARGWWLLNHNDATGAVAELTAAQKHLHDPTIVDSFLAWAKAVAARPRGSNR